MANQAHVVLLLQGRDVWNRWRDENPEIKPDLSTEIMPEADLAGFNLSGCNLVSSILARANLRSADLAHADLTFANLLQARLDGANLCEANLFGANMAMAELTGADLRRATLICAVLVGANLAGADISGSKVYGVAVWDADLSGLHQEDLVITKPEDAEITVDHIEMAQFINLVVHNRKVHDALDSLNSKLVLLLGRFSEERKKVLDILRVALRAEGLVPVVFDFESPTRRDPTETAIIIAGLACFVLADISEARSIPQELAFIVPQFPSLPIALIELETDQPYSLVWNIVRRQNVIGRRVLLYRDTESLQQLVKDHLTAWRTNLNVQVT